MAVSFSKPIIWREENDPQLLSIAALLGDDFIAAQHFMQLLRELQKGFAKSKLTSPWGLVCLPAEDYLLFARMKLAPGRSWVCTLQAADLSPFAGRGAELRSESILPEQGAFAQWAGDDSFLEALRDAAFLTCLAPGGHMHCKMKENRQALAEAALADLLLYALPPQLLRYVSFAAGSGSVPKQTFTLTLSAQGPAEDEAGAFADFTARPLALELRFPQLNFAQRTVKSLLAPLGISTVVSMWNAAARVVADTLGEQAADAQDLITWQMLRKNFSAAQYPITEEEHRQLQKKVRLLHATSTQLPSQNE